VSTVECSYPIPEDASVGFLYIGANVMAIPMTFLGALRCLSVAHLLNLVDLRARGWKRNV
jgi:hypothetical protein